MRRFFNYDFDALETSIETDFSQGRALTFDMSIELGTIEAPTLDVPLSMAAYSTIVSVTGDRDYVHDQTRNILYFTLDDGIVARYDVTNSVLLSSINLGGNLGGLDISQDDNYLYVAQQDYITLPTGATEITVHRIELSTLAVLDFTFPSEDAFGGGPSNDSGAFDISAVSDGSILVSTNYPGSGFTAIYQLSSFDGTLVSTTVSGAGSTSQSSTMYTTFDGNHTLVVESNISDSGFHLFSEATGTFIQNGSLYDYGHSGFNFDRNAISGEANLIFLSSYNAKLLIDFEFNLVADLTPLLGSSSRVGVVFSADGDHLFALSQNSGQIDIIDTESFAIVDSIDLEISSTYFEGNPDGRLVATQDGGTLVLAGTPSVEIIDLSLAMSINLVGTANNDTLNGSVGNDNLSGGEGNDTIIGKSGDDTLIGGMGNDLLNGGDGIDTLRGGDGDDVLNGNAGNDLFFGGAGADTFNGGAGLDRVFYSDAIAGIVANFFKPALNSGDAEGDTYNGIESINGSNFNDTITSGNNNNDLVGLGGDDVLIGAGGRDRLFGGGGDDRLLGGQGNDDLQGNAGIDTYVIQSGAGNDRVFTYEVGVDIIEYNGGPGSFTDLTIEQVGTNTRITSIVGSLTLIGITATDITAAAFTFVNALPDATGVDVFTDLTAGNDVFNGEENDDIVDGLAGNDTIRGGIGDDELMGGEGNDLLTGGLGADILDGGDGIDTVLYNAASTGVTINAVNAALNTGEAAGDTYISIERFTGSNGDDSITSGNADNRLTGLGGDDVLVGAGGNDTLFGGNDDDRLLGGTGDDTLHGQDGADTFVFRANAGNDTISDFEDGIDIMEFKDLVTTFADLTITQSGADTVITSANGQVTLKDFDSTLLDASDFSFL